MGLDAWLQLMEQGPNRELALQGSERGLGLGQLHVLRPQLFGRLCPEIGAQPIGTFARLAPGSCGLLSSARINGRPRPCPPPRPGRDRSPTDAGPESFPAAA